METLSVDFADLKRLVEWSFFIENGDIHNRESSVSEENIELSNRLLNIYFVMKKMRVNNVYKRYNLTQDDCIILHNWFSELPHDLIDNGDAEVYTIIGLFIYNEM